MHYSAKLLSLVATTALMIPLVQIRGFSQDSSHFLQTDFVLAQSEPAEARLNRANRLLQQGIQQALVSHFREALQSWQQALEIYREPEVQAAFPQESRQGEGNALGNLGIAYRNLGDYQQAIDLYEQYLAIAREIGDRRGEGNALGNLGLAYWSLGDYPQAIDLYEQQLVIAREIGDRRGEGNALGNLGITYDNLGDYQQAIDLYEQQLVIAREIGDRSGEGTALGNLGIAYDNLGDYQQAIDFYEQQLVITRKIGDRQGEGAALGNLGSAYLSLGDYPQAIDFYEQVLVIFRKIGDRSGEGTALGNLGSAYLSLGDYQQAIDLYEQRLAIAREIGDRSGEGTALGNLGSAYLSLGDYQQAIERYQQALAIAQEIGDRSSEGVWLSYIGSLLAQQEQPELAIVFYKQSVNVREAIRDDLRELPREQQQSFTDTVADDYRELADLLLQADRVLEAQRVLDLLKVQELDDYLHDVRGNDQTEDGVELVDPEAQISNKAILIGHELADLRAIPYAQLSDEQKQRLADLDEAQRAIIADFRGFINSPEIQALVAQLSVEAREQDVLAELDEFINLQNNLREIDQNAVLIYPLILEDRLELVLITPFSEPTRYPVEVDRAELNETIVAFRQALDDPTSAPQSLAQQLYDWLISPMANDLEAIGAETILYAPDGVLRYIPLAALHDGERWLVEQFHINHITAASLQDFDLQPRIDDPQILAAAFSEGFHEVQAGDRTFPFDGLPFAGQEVENLAAAFPGTTKLLDEDFSRTATEPIMDSHTIVHLATHAAFVQGSPSDSFILFGNGDYVTLEEIKSWEGRFNQVDLIVLSACETGLGGLAFGDSELGNGEEILGFGYLMQQAGAAAAIASLWPVNDGGTQVLMDAFYAALRNGYSKAEALQRAQIALITRDETVLELEGDRGVAVEIIDTRNGQPLSQSNGLAHPYYWAPFILIGNGL
ncbi:MAG: tetratricopeptide repeat protein [Elainellaceae cyanobacterium]